MKIVADQDIVRATLANKLPVRALKIHPILAFPDAFLAFSARGHCVEDAVSAKLDVDEEKGQIGPHKVEIDDY